MTDAIEKRGPCDTCKHFRHLSEAAHQNRCAKFADGEVIPPIAAIRIVGGKCENGKEWE